MKYKRDIIIEKGLRNFSAIERVCFRLEDSFKERSENGKLLFKFNQNLNKKGYVYSFRLRSVITPELVSDIQAWGRHNPEEELNSLLLEHIESEVVQSALNTNMLRTVTNLRTIIIEKKSNSSHFLNKLNLKSLFNIVFKKFNHNKWDLIVSAGIYSLLSDDCNFRIAPEDIEQNNYCLGFDRVGYWLYNKQEKVTIYQNPYFPANKCLVIKNLRDVEFFVTLNYEEMTYDPNTFAPCYKNHEAHVNIPDNVKYHGFEISDIKPYPPLNFR